MLWRPHGRGRLMATATLPDATNPPLRHLMTPNPRTTLPGPTDINVLAIQRRTPANLRLVARRRGCSPMDAGKIVAVSPRLRDYHAPNFADAFDRPDSPTGKAPLDTPRGRRTPIDRG